MAVVAVALLAAGCGSANYTECTKQAAKDSRSDLAMRVLLGACAEEYPNRGGRKTSTSDEDALTGAALAFFPVFAVGYFFGRRSGKRSQRRVATPATTAAAEPGNNQEIMHICRAPAPPKNQLAQVDPRKKAQYREIYENYSIEELLRRRGLGSELDNAAHAAIVDLLKERGVMLPAWRAPTTVRGEPGTDNNMRHP